MKKHAETQEMLATLGARKKLHRKAHATLAAKVEDALDDMNAEALRLLRATRRAMQAETSDDVRGTFGEVETLAKSVQRLTAEVEKPWLELLDVMDQLARVEARLHPRAAAAGYTVAGES